MVETRRKTRRLSTSRLPDSVDSSRTTLPGQVVEGCGSERRRKSEDNSVVNSISMPHTDAVVGETARRVKGKYREISNFFTTMPLDILHEILGYLTPKDLLSVARTNSSFKQTLLGHSANATWIYARRQYGAPSPPLGFNEAQWASLLFEPNCSCCVENQISVVDWLVRKRVCADCRETRLAGERSFRGYDIEMFDCIPRTHNRSRRPETEEEAYDTRKANLYLSDDVHAVASEWKVLKASAHTPEGRERFDAWKHERVEYVTSCNDRNTNRTYEQWEVAYWRVQREEEWQRQERRVERVAERFVELGLGYTEADVKETFNGYYISTNHRQGPENISEEEWFELRPKLEPTVREKCQERLEEEEKALKTMIVQTYEVVYEVALNWMAPAQRYLCPSVGFLRSNIQGAWGLIQVCIAKKSEQDMLLGTMVPGLMGLLQDYIDERKKKVTRAPTVQEAEKALALAQNVYFCENSSPPSIFVGWPSMAYHAQTLGSEWFHSFSMGWRTLELWCHPELDKCSSKLSSTLIELAGLDPAIATIDQMDARDARFVLMKEYHGGPYRFGEDTVQVFTWRGALQYYVDSGPTYGRTPQPTFRPASEEETQAAREHTASLERIAKAWSCNHCHAFYGEADVQTKAVILDHLKGEHDVSAPVVASDYIVHPKLRMELETNYELPGSPFDGHEEYHTKEESPDSLLEALGLAPW